MKTHRPKELDDIERRVRPRPIPRYESKLVPAIVGGFVLLGLCIWSVGLMTSLRWVLERVA